MTDGRLILTSCQACGTGMARRKSLVELEKCEGGQPVCVWLTVSSDLSLTEAVKRERKREKKKQRKQKAYLALCRKAVPKAEVAMIVI